MIDLKVIDFHVHIFPDKIAEKAVSALNAEHAGHKLSTDGTLGGLLRQMDLQNITCSVIQPVATKSDQVVSINNWMLEIRSERIYTFGAMHPDFENPAEELERLKSLGFKGIKIQPDWIGRDLNHKSYYNIYDICSELGLCIMFHMGGEIAPVPTVHALPHMLAEILDDFPKLKAVAAHMGGFMEWENVWDTLVGRDVYMDTSVCFSHIWDEKEFERMIKAHGAERILFASDNPMMEPEYPLAQIMKFNLSDEEKGAILYKNALGILEGENR